MPIFGVELLKASSKASRSLGVYLDFRRLALGDLDGCWRLCFDRVPAPGVGDSQKPDGDGPLADCTSSQVELTS